jgi:hypothetical protein
MIKLFNEKSRVVKNEQDSYLWKVGNGYKMSRKARLMLGIADNTIHNLAIGTTEDDSTLLIKSVNTKEEGNCSVNKQNVISSNRVVTALDNFGERFKVTKDTHDGFFIMSVEDKIVENISTETSVEEEIEENEEIAVGDGF